MPSPAASSALAPLLALVIACGASGGGEPTEPSRPPSTELEGADPDGALPDTDTDGDGDPDTFTTAGGERMRIDRKHCCSVTDTPETRDPAGLARLAEPCAGKYYIPEPACHGTPPSEEMVLRERKEAESCLRRCQCRSTPDCGPVP